MITNLTNLVRTFILLNIFVFFVRHFLCQMPGVSYTQGCVSVPGLTLTFLSVPGLISFLFLRDLCLRFLPAKLEIFPIMILFIFQSSRLGIKLQPALMIFLVVCKHFPSVKSWWDFLKHSTRSQIISFFLRLSAGGSRTSAFFWLNA